MFNAVVKQNDGSSYMFFTALTLSLGPMFIAITQSVDTEAMNIVFAVFAGCITALNLAHIASFGFRLWIGQVIEISPRSSAWTRFWSYPPWQLVRALDSFIPLCASFSYVILTFWLFDETPDKNHYFDSFCELAGCHNIWGAWNLAIDQSVSLVVAGAAPMKPHSQSANTVSWLIAGSSWIFLALILLIAVTVGLEQMNKRQHGILRKAGHRVKLDTTRGDGDESLISRESRPSRSVVSDDPEKANLSGSDEDF